MRRVLSKRKSGHSSNRFRINSQLPHHQSREDHPITANTRMSSSDPLISNHESMDAKIDWIQNKIDNLEKDLEEMKGHMKELLKYSLSSKIKETAMENSHAYSSLYKSPDDDNDDVSNGLTPVISMDVADRDGTLDTSKIIDNLGNEEVAVAANDTSTSLNKASNDNVSNEFILIPPASSDVADLENIINIGTNHGHSGSHPAKSHSVIPNNVHKKRKPQVYNTEGIYMHAIISITYFEAGPIKSWIYAIGIFLLVTSQIVLLHFIRQDRLISDFCEELGPALTGTLMAMAIIFASIVFADIEESAVEEAVLNHAVKYRTENISSLRATGLIRICLRVRRFFLPWWLLRSEMLVILSNTNLDHSQIILNFVSISVIVEADNLLGRFFFSETYNQVLDQLLDAINTGHDDVDKKNVFTSISSRFGSQMLAIIPTMIMTIWSITVKAMNGCVEKLDHLITVLAAQILPHVMMLIYSIASGIHDNHSHTLFERCVRFLGDWNLNMIAYMWVVVTANMFSSSELYRDADFLTFIGVAWFSLLVFLLLRSIYVNHVHNQEKTWKHVVYVISITSCLMLIYIYILLESFGISIF